MSYENAPATEMLATHCAACRRPLLDSVSVEIGMGPDCREKYGYHDTVPPEARSEANEIVHAVATSRDRETAATAADRLKELGFARLAAILVERNVQVVVSEEDGRVFLRAPYSEQATAVLRKVPGRQWDKERKVNTFPTSSKNALWKVLKVAYPGMLGYGPKGTFKVE